ncbi:MAG TPA: mannose-6-phosphate isomerase, class I [Flavitalea sp.]|nr:mannose-6-phosphate isomerase, class I [Flavitalea sp.]
MDNTNKLFRLKGRVQHYDWGGFSFLPELLKLPNPEKKPFAEYWLGAHEKSPSLVIEENRAAQDLDVFLNEKPEERLGAQPYKRFGRLPYLLKVLDVRDMLSIQVHPTKQAAEQKFEEENRKGIPLTAANRNYKDNNHKPELLSPLGDMYLLHGFKAPALLRNTLESEPALSFLLEDFKEDDYRSLYARVMTMPQEEVNERLQPLLDKIIPPYHAGRLTKEEESFWAARAAVSFNKGGDIDRGIYSIFFFNLVRLTEGEALFQDAGLPHAYLEGQTIEIMANSDNVLRGGLTPKHIDVKELMEHIRFVATRPDIIRRDMAAAVSDPAGSGAVLQQMKTNGAAAEQVFVSPAPDFRLSRILLHKGQFFSAPANTAEIYFVYTGEVLATGEGRELSLGRGEALLSLAGNLLRLVAAVETIVFRASVP